MVKFTKKTKIVATLGPATETKEVMLKMIESGADVFRINFSHAPYDVVKRRIQCIREINQEYGYSIAILADLQGPKLRIGEVEEGVFLNPDDVLTFTNNRTVGNATQVYMTYENFARDVAVGERILIDDGKLMLEVLETNNKDIVKAKVIQGGALKSKKGVNLPNTKISLPALTPKDIEDAIFSCQQEVDWIALSFVRTPQDLMDLKELINKNAATKIPIIAKIEKPEAVENLELLVPYCDALMVARGDLGVEIPPEQVPLVQKRIVNVAKFHRKPVIIATQMMESMIDSLTPTRAEVNDVANSVLDGADAVMLSGETSVGKYPAEVIKQMATILEAVEMDRSITVSEHQPTVSDEYYITNMSCYTAAKLVPRVKAKVITSLTHSGYTAFQISSHRPHAHILVFTDNPKAVCMLNLLWGVRAFMYDDKNKSQKEILDHVKNVALECGVIQRGEYIVNLFSIPAFEKGKTNSVILDYA